MLLGSPTETPYDLRFRLFDVPVRVHPLFWLVMLMISPYTKQPLGSATFIVAAFISILVHEFGHALSSRWLGREPGGVVLYAMGGFCYYESEGQSPWKRIIVLASGPGSGFALMGLVLALGAWRFGIRPADAMALIGIGNGDGVQAAVLLPPSMAFRYMFQNLLIINFYWGVFNLFPIWPLDGGQMTTTFLSMVSPRSGLRWGHVISFLTASGLAIWEFSQHSPWNALWVGSFAVINFQILQSMHAESRVSEDPEWWRR